MDKNITSLGNEYMDNTIKKIKEIREAKKKQLSELEKTLQLIDVQYKDDVREEIERLRPTDRALIGNILAICKRSDRNLGRPEEDCKNSDESIYVVVSPSRESIITCKDLNNVAAKNGKFKFVSINYLIDQILEFNFTYIQIALGAELQVFNGYYSIMSSVMREIGKERNNDIYTKLIVNKAIGTAYSVLSDLEKGKFNQEQCNNRLFFIYNAINLAETYMEDKILSFCKNGTKFNEDIYNKYIRNYSQDSVDYIKERLKVLEKSTEEFPVVDKETAKLIKLTIKSNILEQVAKEALDIGQEDTDDNK